MSTKTLFMRSQLIENIIKVELQKRVENTIILCNYIHHKTVIFYVFILRGIVLEYILSRKQIIFTLNIFIYTYMYIDIEINIISYMFRNNLVLKV